MPFDSTLDPAVAALVETFGLAPHPEGGFFRETYRSSDVLPAIALPGRFASARAASTAILYLLPQGAVSKLHRLRSDEVWHFYAGDPLEIVTLTPEGASTIELRSDGPHPVFQTVVRAGLWFGARVKGRFALAGCTVAPGFDFADFEMGDRAALAAEFPKARDVINELA